MTNAPVIQEVPELEAGDIILTRANTLLSKAIRWFEKKRSGDSRFSHAALALGELTTQEEVIESLIKVTRGPLSKYNGQQIIVYRMKGLTDKQRNEIVLKAVSVEKEGYAWFKIPLFAMDSIFRTYFFTRYFGLSNFKVCSELIAWAYETVLGKKPFGLGWRSVSPDVIDDFCANGPLNWEVIYSSL